MKNFILFIISLTLAGCVSLTKQYTDRGDYAGLLYISISSFGKDLPTPEEVSKILKSKASGDYKKFFYHKTIEYINVNRKRDSSFFYVMRKYIDSAKKYELFTEEQAFDVESRVTTLLADYALYGDKISDDLQSLYPKYQASASQNFSFELEKAFKGDLDNLSDYIILLKKIPSTDMSGQLALADGALIYLNKKLREGFQEIEDKDIVSIMNLREIPGADKKFDEYISLIKLTRRQLNNLVFERSQELFLKEEKRRDLAVDFVADEDELFVNEIIQGVIALDDWIRIDDSSSYKIYLKSVSFKEVISSPVVQSKYIKPTDFATVMYIPKNASIIFDYSLQKVNFQWSLNIFNNKNKKSKIISGRENSEFKECFNLRYKNVFGGEGLLPTNPPQYSDFCYGSYDKNPDNLRKYIVRNIVIDVKNFVLENR